MALDAPVAIHLCGPPEGARITPGGRAAHALCSTLLQVGFTEPPESPLALVRSYRTVSALPVARGPIGGLSLLHCPSGHPDLALASFLPDGVPTFLDTIMETMSCRDHLADSPPLMSLWRAESTQHSMYS